MAYVQSFEIGTTYAGRVNVESLTTTPNMGPRSKPLLYEETVTLASSARVGRGSPVEVWSWGFIPADLFAAFRVICPGASVNVIIRTLKADYSTYEYYSAVMIWPDQDSYEYRSGKYQPFELRFEKKSVYTP